MDWDRVHHAYGRATDVPKYLEALRNGDPQAIEWLSGTMAHQGTRWQASCHIVPFLVELIDDPAVPHRAEITRLLRYIAVGAHQLPFDPGRYADVATDEQVDAVIQYTYYGEQADVEFADAVAVRWESDAYFAAAQHIGTYCRWLAEPEVGPEAATMLAWFSLPDDVIRALVALPADASARASANLTLAYVTSTDPAIDARLRELLGTTRPVSVTAAVALAFRLGGNLPDHALDVLADDDLPGTPAGWDRSMRGFVAMALRRTGL